MLSTWRKSAGLSRAECGRRLGIGGTNPSRAFERIETGELQADADLTERILKLTEGQVGPAELHAVRLAWLTAKRASTPEIGEGGGEAGGGEGASVEASGHEAKVATDTAAVTANDAGGFA